MCPLSIHGCVITTLTVLFSTFMNLSNCTQFFQPCGDVIHSKLKDSWFEWGRLYSFCMDYDFVIGTNSTLDRGCMTKKCKQCMSVCDKKMTSKSLSECKVGCNSSSYCERGCEFYAQLVNNTGEFRLNSSLIPKGKSNLVRVKPGMRNVTFSWESFQSDGNRRLPSVYLITIHANSSKKFEYYIGYTQATQLSLSMNTMCKEMKRYIKYQREAKMAIKVYPINFNGRSEALQSAYTAPIEASPVQNVTIGLPVFQQREYVKWLVSWSTPTDSRSENKGVRYYYQIDSCSDRKIYENLKDIQEIEDEGYSTTESKAPVEIRNTQYDELQTCKIRVDIRVKYGNCFLGRPFYGYITYTGCKGVSNYSNPCPPRQYTFATVTDIVPKDYTCDNYTVSVGENNIRCNNCHHQRYNVSVSWDPFNTSFILHNYTVRWGYAARGNLRYGEAFKTVSADTTSCIITSQLFKNEYQLGVQVYANTDNSRNDRGRWHVKDSLSKKQLESPKPECTPPPPKRTQNTTVVIIVTLFTLVLIGIIIIMFVYRRIKGRRRRGKNLNFGDYRMYMDPQSADNVDDWEIPPSYISVKEQIGEGAFGTVYSANIQTSVLAESKYGKQCCGASLINDVTTVAVKFLKERASDEEYKDFEEEISLMKSIGYHKNIVNMIGCNTIKPPLCLIVEYMEHGDLLNYMRRQRLSNLKSELIAPNSQTESILSTEVMMRFMWQIACGMEYLAANNVVHRDLAARNILVGSDNIIKISDFGLSRHLTDEMIYVSKNRLRRLPIKWMSIEAIHNQEFTSASDVWAYGIVLFEIVTLGGTPYPTTENRELGKILTSGYRMEKPDNCSPEMYEVMLHCWNEDPAQRPTFAELREHIEENVEHDFYFSFEIDENETYYNIASFRSINSDNEEEKKNTGKYNHQPKEVEKIRISLGDGLHSNSEPMERYHSPQVIKLFENNAASFDNPNYIN